jgi:hypothetical protein
MQQKNLKHNMRIIRLLNGERCMESLNTSPQASKSKDNPSPLSKSMKKGDTHKIKVNLCNLKELEEEKEHSTIPKSDPES